MEGPTPSQAAGYREALSREGGWHPEMSISTSRIRACPDLLGTGTDLWEKEEEGWMRGGRAPNIGEVVLVLMGKSLFSAYGNDTFPAPCLFFGSQVMGRSQCPASVSPPVPRHLASPMQWPKTPHGNDWASSKVIQEWGKKKRKISLEMVQLCHPTPPSASPSTGWEQSWSEGWAGRSSPPGCTSSHSP